MRRLISFACGVAALFAGLVTLPVAWVAHNVANEDGYVSFTEPFARDSAFHAAVATAVSGALVDRSALPTVLRPATTAAIYAATEKIADTPGFVTAWDATQRQSHRIMFADQRTLDPDLNASSQLAVDLGPLGKFVIEQANKVLPAQITAPKQMVVTVGGNVGSSQLEQIKKTPGYANKGMLAIAALTALCLVFARKRGTAVALLGLGVVGLAGLTHVLSSIVVPRIVDRNTAPSSFAKEMIDVLIDRGNASFDHWLIGIAVAGAVAVVVGGASSVGGFSRRSTA